MRHSHLALALGVGLVALAALVGLRSEPAVADVPNDPAAFSTPLDIDNELLPFVPGAVLVYAGRSNGRAITIVVRHTEQVREFAWNDSLVPCRVVEELVFERGLVTGTEQLFLAQDDDGAVWSFGEIEDDDPSDDGGDDAEDESGGWIVGATAPGDPEDVSIATDPALAMPATPARGDRWRVSDTAPFHIVELRAKSTSSRVRTRAGRFTDCLRVQEVDLPDDTKETLWFAPGVGLVRSRARGERIALRAGSLVPRSRR